jgi:hypothetical protein
MGRFSRVVDRALKRRQERLEAARKAQEDARRAAIPLYEKVMPLLQEAESDLERAEIKVDYEPPLHFARAEDKQYLLFQLKPKSGIRTSIYRVAYNIRTQELWAYRHWQARKMQVLFHCLIYELADNQIIDILKTAILEATQF